MTGTFGVLDYLVFFATILIAVGIGIAFAVRARWRNRNTPDDYFLAGRKSKMLPVTLSFVVTFQSSIMMIGYPAETYTYGLILVYSVVTVILAFVFTAFFVVPIFHPLKLTSVYQYFNLRYGDNYVRYLTLSTGTFYSIFYMATVTYGTCVALEVVMGLPIWATIIMYTMVTAVYTSIGGIKAVIWTDVFQFVVMVTGILAIIIKASMDTDGLSNVFKHAENRVNLDEVALDPRIRYTAWNICFGSFSYWLYTSYMQPAMQRVYTTPDVKSARRLYLFTVPIYCFIMTLTCIEGVVIYGYYANKGCDILEAGVVDNVNAIIPFTVLELFLNHSGLAGLFIAALSSAALSTLSSCLSSLSAVTYEDIIKVRNPNISDENATRLSKIVVLVYGVIAMMMSFAISVLPGTVQALFQTFASCLDGPTCAVFLVSTMFRRATTKGVCIGAIAGMVIPMWINFGRLFSSIPGDPRLPGGPTDSCDVYNDTLLLGNQSLLSNASSLTYNESVSPLNVSRYSLTTLQSSLGAASSTTLSGAAASYAYTGLDEFYRTSYMWLSLVGLTVAIVTSIIASLLTTPPEKIDKRCLFSWKKHIMQELFENDNDKQSTNEHHDSEAMRTFINRDKDSNK